MSKFIEMTESEWEEKYKPMTNTITNDGTTYETYGDELDFVMSQKPEHIWTEIDGDDGVYIVNGYHLVNRLSYYITNVPHNEDDHIQICICKFVECPCSELTEDKEPNPDCEQCWGDGMYTEWKN